MNHDEATHLRLFKILTEHYQYTRREIAARMRLGLYKKHFWLNAFISKGLVKVGKFLSTRAKRVYAYLLTLQGIEDNARITIRFLQCKLSMYNALITKIGALPREAEALDAEQLDAVRNA
ncbi:MarR family EPS-associated transcriptional regulator [Candidatus Igneacidithiobacillus taiwanensis]|uniref:MarR family EPS-associated transcriptional regulator n=1 Tax=Candidatus Igneacidithiobacillus taiwanensis TaxID=1945924 RepID=UPI0028A09473|nr:MarR family EPS-associated transcriptional regulator [Candidatus Igneacidithiobacillus taiwanensis]